LDDRTNITFVLRNLVREKVVLLFVHATQYLSALGASEHPVEVPFHHRWKDAVYLDLLSPHSSFVQKSDFFDTFLVRLERFDIRQEML
jgi:hypothetical protein